MGMYILNLFKHLGLAILLIMVTSGILLFSDLNRRVSNKSEESTGQPQIALMQIISTPLLDAHVAGVKDGLRKRGLLASDEHNFHLFNPQGDFSTANAAAREMVQGGYDLLMSSSTVALQTLAKANRETRVPHVFGAVTFPQGAGVGIMGPGADEHPPYLAGIGTFQPVKRAFRIAHELNPSIKRVGVVWNPGEQCSEACLKEAREVCATLNISLEEATATQTGEVGDAVRSLIGREVDAIWIGGDTVATAASTLIIHLAQQAEIPVFTNDPTDSQHGALFGVGADYYTVGLYTADMAAEILNGRSPASFRIENVIPEQLAVNDALLVALSPVWKTTDNIRAMTVKQKAETEKDVELKPEPGREYTIGLSYFVPAPIFEQAIDGFRNELKAHGFIEGQNLNLILRHANADMSMLPQITAALVHESPDVIVPFSTPCLGSAIARAKGYNIVFGIVSAPLEAGAGKSFDDHLPHVTGIVQLLPTEELFRRVRELFPRAKRIGALYNPSEANAVKEVADLKRIFEPLGFELVTVAVYSTSEIPENFKALLAKQVDLIFLMADNTTANGMPFIVQGGRQEGIPVLAEDKSLMGAGALLSCAPGPYSDGADTARLALRVMLGESPANIPIAPGGKNELTLDLGSAKEQNIIFSSELLARADWYFNMARAHGSPARIALVNLVENPSLDLAAEGLEQGLQSCGLRPDVDYTIQTYCAQGEMGQLPQLFDAALMNESDLVFTLTTPALIAGVKKVKEIPLVFSVASDPVKLNLFTNGRPANVCGVHDDPPIDDLVDMAMRYKPALKTMGVLYDPSQMNAVISVEKLRKAAQARGLNLIECTASSVTDLPVGVQSIIQRGAEALMVSADNLMTTGFGAIAKAAASEQIPIFTTEPSLMKLGATGCIGDDYGAWGRQAGRLGARILAGVPPDQLPIESTSEWVTLEPKGGE